MKLRLHPSTLLVFIGLLCGSLGLQAQEVIMPVNGSGPVQTSCNGVLLDSGGFGDYQNNVNSTITISPTGASQITLQFASLEFETCCDGLRVFDGPNTASPMIGDYKVFGDLPPGGLLVIDGEDVTFQLYTDISVVRPGFEMEWTALCCADSYVADFDISDANPPVGTSVGFSNDPEGIGFWDWDFGDGGNSTLPAPTHTYGTPGEYTVSLTLTDCLDGTNIQTVTHTVTVQGFPEAEVNAPPCEATLDYGQTQDGQITITNPGDGDLVLTIDGTQLMAQNPVEVLMLGNGADFAQEYVTTISAINSFFTAYNLTEITTYDAIELQVALAGKDVLIIPEQETCTSDNADAFADFAPVLESFITAGGTVVQCGTNNEECVFSLGLFEGEYETFLFAENVTVVAPDDPLMDNVSPTYTALISTYTYDITNPDVVRLVEDQDGFDVVCYRNIGAGRAILIGHDYFNITSNDINRIIANAVRTSGNIGSGPQWLLSSQIADTLGAGETLLLDIQFVANVPDGVYTQDIVISTNDPDNPTITIPCTLTVNNTPAIIFSDFVIDFGEAQQNETLTESIDIINTTGGAITITGITSSDPAFEIDPTSFVLGGNGEDQLTLTFTPTLIGDYNATVTVSTSAGDFTFTLIGQGVGAPIIGVTPNPVEVTLDAGTDTQIPFTISNTGEGSLQFTIIGTPQSWFSYTPPSGLVGFPGSTNITLTFDASNLLGGVYNTSIIIQTNDPLNNTYTVPVTLNVIGYPEVVSDPTSLDFGNVIIGNTNTLTVELTNEGTADLVISDIVPDFAVYDISPTNATLAPGESITVTITFVPDAIQDFSGEITIVSNNTAGDYTINVSGIGVGAPNASATPSPIEVTLLAGDNTNEEFVISNTGGEGPLEYEILDIGGFPDWLTISNGETADQLAIDGSATIGINIDASGMLAGTYDHLVVIATNDPANPEVTVLVSLTVEAFPQTNFSANSEISCDGIVVFTDETLNIPTGWNWDFGDGSTADTQNPTHTYTAAGFYTVTLEACNDLGCDDEVKTDYIEVNFDYEYCDTIYFPTAGLQTITSCSGVMYDSGGPSGNYSNNESGTVTISPPGATSISLQFSSMNMESCCDEIYIYDGPTAASPLLGEFTGTSLPLGSGTIVSTGGSITIVMNSDFSATPAGFAFTWDCVAINDVPNANFSYEIVDTCLGIVEFTQASDNFPDTWAWEFGDGGTDSGETATHSYLGNETYEVTLEACNFIGCNSSTVPITLQGVLNVDFTVPEYVEQGQTVMFVDNTEGAVSWNWNLGNGNIAIGIPTPITVYNTLGTVSVTLEVTNEQGCVRSYTQEFEVVPYTGINDPQRGTLTPYPNPMGDILNVRYEFDGLRDITLRLLDVTGRQIDLAAYSNAAGMVSHHFNTAALPQGTYYLAMTYKGGQIVRKVVKF